MRTTSPRKQTPAGPPRETPRPDAAADEGCIYCLPPVEGSRPDDSKHHTHECMIKRLGSWERRQVSLLLHKAGFEEHLFTCGCPASKTRAFHDCPFYENEADLEREP